METPAGTVLEGKVTGITNFGAFVALPEGRTGLVHISEIADGFVRDVKDHLALDQTVRVLVLSVDPGGRVNLSIRRLERGAARQEAPRKDASFEDKLKRFIRDSNEKQVDLKRNYDAKRGR
jgi:S1 RNA binding domain protein